MSNPIGDAHYETLQSWIAQKKGSDGAIRRKADGSPEMGGIPLGTDGWFNITAIARECGFGDRSIIKNSRRAMAALEAFARELGMVAHRPSEGKCSQTASTLSQREIQRLKDDKTRLEQNLALTARDLQLARAEIAALKREKAQCEMIEELQVTTGRRIPSVAARPADREASE